MAAIPLSQGWQLGSQVGQLMISVKKENSKPGTYNDRSMMIRAPFLFMLEGQKVKRALMITQIERVEVSGARILIKATQNSCQRDWMLTMMPDGKNTHRSMDDVARLIKQLGEEFGGNLEVANNITSRPQLKRLPGMQTTAEILKKIKQNKQAIPKRVPPPEPPPPDPSLPPTGGQPDSSPGVDPPPVYQEEKQTPEPQEIEKRPPLTHGRFNLKINPDTEEDLGFYTTEHSIPGRPVRVKAVDPSSAAGRANIVANNLLPCYITKLDDVRVMSPHHFHNMVEDKILNNQTEFQVEISEGEPIGNTPDPSDSESSSVVTDPSSRDVYRSNTEDSIEKPPPQHIAKKKKREPFWADFVASYDAQKRHWDTIEPRVINIVDSNLESNVVPIDFEMEAKFLRDSRLTKTLRSRPHDYNITKGGDRYNRFERRGSGRGLSKHLPGAGSVVDAYIPDSHYHPSLTQRFQSGQGAYERGYTDGFRERSRSSNEDSPPRGRGGGNYRRGFPKSGNDPLRMVI